MKKEEPTDKQDIASQMALFFWGKMAEQERLKIIHRTQRGIKGRVVKKRCDTGWLPAPVRLSLAGQRDDLGGRNDHRTQSTLRNLQPEAKYVRAMMHWARLGMSERKIAKSLTDMKVPSPER